MSLETEEELLLDDPLPSVAIKIEPHSVIDPLSDPFIMEEEKKDTDELLSTPTKAPAPYEEYGTPPIILPHQPLDDITEELLIKNGDEDDHFDAAAARATLLRDDVPAAPLGEGDKDKESCSIQ